MIQYCPFADGVDDLAGHGTHTAGTLVGQCAEEEPDQQYRSMNGLAAGAKIAFFDLGFSPSTEDPDAGARSQGTA